MRKYLIAAAVVLFAGCGQSPTPTFESATLTTVDPTFDPRLYVVETTVPTTAPPTTVTTRPPRPSRDRARLAPAPTAPPQLETVYAGGDVWDWLAACESGGRKLEGINPQAVAKDKYFGAFQFMLATWRSNGGKGSPLDHTYAEQKVVAKRIPLSAWGSQFPICGAWAKQRVRG